MNNFNLCGICLIQNVKMYKYENHIKTYYDEIITNAQENVRPQPQWFCYECAYLLRKYYNFKQKCYRGIKTLLEIVENGPHKLHYNDINKILRKRRQQSSIQIACISNDKVKTYRYEHGTVKILNDHSLTFKSTPLIILERTCIDELKEPIVIEKVFTNENETDEVLNDDINLNEDIQSDNNEYENKPQENRIDMKSAEILVNDDLVMEISVNKNEGNKFERSIKKKFLNPSHWRKISLTDTNAEREFKAKSVDQKYLKARFKCTDCYRGFSQEEMLIRHQKIKHCKSLGPFECRLCHMRVKWKSRLEKHLKQHYTIYKCLRCELSFSVEDAAFKHDEFHNGVIKTCPHCGEQFSHTSTFYTHLRKHRSKYVCTLCGTSYLSEFGLYMHKKVKHVLANSELPKIDESMLCEVCDIKFESQTAYEQHLEESALHSQCIATQRIKDETESTPQPLKWRYTPRRTPRKYTRCSVCEKNFSTYVAYSKHHRCEHPETPLAASPYKTNARKICEMCGASVAAVSLASHLNTHTREKRHKCNICGMQLSSKSGLNRHRSTHTGEKPNKCNLCHKQFAHTTNMKLHYRTVHLKESCKSKK